MADVLMQMQILVQGDHNVVFVLHVKVLLALQVWRMPDLVLVTTLRGHKRGVWAAQFSPVDQAVATASGLPALHALHAVPMLCMPYNRNERSEQPQCYSCDPLYSSMRT